MGVCESTAAPVELDGSDLAGPKKELTADAMDTDDQSQAVATSIEAEQRIISANRDGLIEVFMLLDQDQDGLVSCEELMRICVANSEAQELMSEYDQDGDEHISVDEWLQAAAGQDPQLIKDAIAMLAEAKQKDNWVTPACRFGAFADFEFFVCRQSVMPSNTVITTTSYSSLCNTGC